MDNDAEESQRSKPLSSIVFLPPVLDTTPLARVLERTPKRTPKRLKMIGSDKAGNA